MSSPLRSRTAFCVLSVCVVSACGGGSEGSSGDLDALANQMPASNEVVILSKSSELKGTSAAQRRLVLTQEPASHITVFGAYTAGSRNLSSDGVLMKVGYLKDSKSKYFIHAEVPGSDERYDCISSAWTEPEKAAALNQYGSVPATCGSGISFDGATDQLTMTRGSLPSASGGQLILNVNTRLLPIDFSATPY